MNLKTTLISILLGGSCLLTGCLNEEIGGELDQSSTLPSVPPDTIPEKVIISTASTDFDVAEGQAINLILVFNRPVPQATAIEWSIAGGNSDFTPSSGQLDLAKSDSSAIVTFVANLDDLYEGNESFDLVITGSPEVFFSAVTVSIGIDEDGDVPQLAFASSMTNATEVAGSVSLQVNLSQAADEIVEVAFNTTGDAISGPGGDFTLAPANIIFSPGETSRAIPVLINDDLSIESLESVTFNLTSVVRGPAIIDPNGNTHNLYIQDNDGAAFSIVGVTGGADTNQDSWLTAASNPTAHWTDLNASEIGYDVTIYEQDASTVACPTESVGPNVVSATFGGCTLTEGQYYKIGLVAIDGGGNPPVAGNNLFSFKVDTLPPQSFSIDGISGGTDVTKDAYLSQGTNPTVHWADSTDEFAYRVTIFENDGSTVACAQETKAANIVSHSFGSCNLTLGQSYRAEVIAFDEAGNSAPANNSQFPFNVISGPGFFNIVGVLGGSDYFPDAFLTDNVGPVVIWEDTVNEDFYDVTIYENDEATVKCPKKRVAKDTYLYSFAGCGLDNGAVYKVEVVAGDNQGNLRTALNSYFTVTKAVGVTPFNILGVTGGSLDVTADNAMTDGSNVVVRWQAPSGAKNFNVTIYENDGFTVACPTVVKPGNINLHEFTGCPLELGSNYIIDLRAYSFNDEEFVSTNNLYSFQVQAGMYVSGAGGSFLNGVALNCGGNDACNSSTPYVPTSQISVFRLKVVNSGMIRAPGWSSGTPSVGNGILDINVVDLEVENGSFIDANGAGYIHSGSGYPGTNSNAGGGSYGGRGGSSGNAAGPVYGSPEDPNTIGSAGGYGNHASAPGGNGGGRIVIQVANELILNGTIRTNGNNGGYYFGIRCGGGGSGGSLSIQAYRVLGLSGRVQAVGGNAGCGNGHGGGGRVKLTYDIDAFTGGIKNGLAAQSLFRGGGNSGGAATVLLDDLGLPEKTLLIDNANGPTGVTYLSADLNVDNLIVKNRGHLVINSGISLTATNGISLASSAYISNYGILDSGSPTGFGVSGSTVINYGTFLQSISSINFYLINYGTIPFPSDSPIIASGGTYEISGVHNYTNLTIQSGGNLTHPDNGSSQANILQVNLSGNMTIANGATINLNSRGYSETYGPGTGGYNNDFGGGAGHGGLGGRAGWNKNAGTRGASYGDMKNPQAIGSGGGNANGYAGGDGGGACVLNVSGTLTLNGDIYADGQAGAYNTSGYLWDAGGGGSGGSINLTANTIAGSSGRLFARGGNAGEHPGASGAGGRIALNFSNDSFSGGVVAGLMAQSSAQSGGNTTGLNFGGAGTIYVNDLGTGEDTLIIDNNGNVYGETPLAADLTIDNLILRNGGKLVIPAGISLTVAGVYDFTGGVLANRGTFTNSFSVLNWHLLVGPGAVFNIPSNDLTIASGGKLELESTFSLNSLTVQSGGIITHPHNHPGGYYLVDLTVTNDMDLQSGASVDVYTRGHYILGPSGCSYGSSPGHGGLGSAGSSIYGSFTNPVSVGSAGCVSVNWYGAGYGGGAAKLTVGGTLTLNGVISANASGGSGNVFQPAGGGSGGSINITASTLSGSTGSLSARGGYSPNGNNAGGGGRISLKMTTDSYTGGVVSLPMDVNSGGSTQPGTIYVSPTVSEDFSSETLGAFTLNRNSSGTYFDSAGVMQLAGVNIPRFGYEPSTLEFKGFLIEELRSNICLYSEEIDDVSWVKTNASVTTENIEALDSNTTGDLLVDDATDGEHGILQDLTLEDNSLYSFSVFVQIQNHDQIALRTNDKSGAQGITYFNLASATVGSTDASHDSNILFIRDDWYRISVTFDSSSGGSTPSVEVLIAETDLDHSFAGNGIDGIYIWGAQVEKGRHPTSYIPTVATSEIREADLVVRSSLSDFFDERGTFHYKVSSLYLDDTGMTLGSLTDGTSNDLYRMDFNGSYNPVMTATALTGTNSVSQGHTWSALVDKLVFGIYSSGSISLGVNSEALASGGGAHVPSGLTEFTLGGENSSVDFNGYIKEFHYYPYNFTSSSIRDLNL